MLNSNPCILCGDFIKDPLCNDCYINQTKILLNDLEIHTIAKDFINDKIEDLFHLETLNQVKCVLCKKDIVSICHNCFLEYLITLLREINFTESLIESLECAPIYDEAFFEEEFAMK